MQIIWYKRQTETIENEVKNSNITVYYNDPAYEGEDIKRSASIDDMKSQLPETPFNFAKAYSVRNNEERIDD